MYGHQTAGLVPIASPQKSGQCAGQEDFCDSEIDDNPGCVENGRDKGCRSACRVDVAEFEQERQHGTDERSIDDEDADADGNGCGEWCEADTVGEHSEEMIGENDDKPYYGECCTEAAADDELAFEDSENVAQADFAECHGTGNEGRGLRTGVAAGSHDEGDKDAQNNGR